ncbi:MAG TPA: hypothetical protein VJV79_17320 [Polyangiaceae bacterium]|nr:hypothetical protein [Polyangiaceae bacterium]
MRTRLILGSVPALLLLLSRSAQALPGTHAPGISTYDTRASSVVLAYRHSASDAGPINTFSYNANFSNTTGILSAQFGIHYVNFDAKANDSTAHGVGASGVALFVFPVAARWADGVPKAAIAFNVGSVPTVYVSGQRQYVTLPLILGFGVPVSPHRAITLTPWFEASFSANLDTIFKSTDITVGPDAVTTKVNPDGTINVSLKDGAVEAAVKKGVSVDSGFYVPMRAGLETSIHLSQSVDFNLYSSIGTFGGAFAGSSAFTLGAGLGYRWDDIAPAVLPVERRLEREDCEAIEARFRSCPSADQWLTPEQRAKEPQPVQPIEPAAAPAAAPVSPAPPAAPTPTLPPVTPPAAPAGTPSGEPPSAAFAN